MVHLRLDGLPPQAVADFLKALDVAPSTVDTYREALKAFARWSKDARSGSGSGLSPERIRAYREWLQAHRAANTASTYLVALRRFLGHCVERGWLRENPAEGVRGVRKPRGHLRHDLSRAQIRAILESIDRDTPIGRRDFAMINLMVRAGLRVVEVQRANVGDLETIRGRTILRVLGKGREVRDEFVVLTEPSVRALEAYLALRRPLRAEEPLFVGAGGRNAGRRLTTRTIRRRVDLYLRRAKVKTEKVSPHSLRHSFVTLAIQGGATLLQAQTAARHRSIQTTLIYFHEHGRLEDPVEDKIQI